MSGYRQWMCVLCGFVYDEAAGLPEEGLAPGTRWHDIPDDFECPDCGFGKADFEMVELPGPTLAGVQGDVVIIGGGMAAFALVEQLRMADRNGRITLVTASDGSQFYKPSLSTAYGSKRARVDMVTATADAFAAAHDVDLRTRVRIVAIDREARTVVTEDGEALAYDTLVLATGASARRLRLPDCGETAPVHYLNDLDDYDALSAALEHARRVAIIGGGLIGCELAETLALAGRSVTVFETRDLPVANTFPAATGRSILSALLGLGITWRGGASIRAVDRVGETGGGARLRVAEQDGPDHVFDCAVVSIGVIPNAGLARTCGLTVTEAGAVRVDQDWRTDDPHIFALGDCAARQASHRPFVETIIRASVVVAAAIRGAVVRRTEEADSVVLKMRSLPVLKVGHGDPSDPGPAASPQRPEQGRGNEGRRGIQWLYDAAGSPSGLILSGTVGSLSQARSQLTQAQQAHARTIAHAV